MVDAVSNSTNGPSASTNAGAALAQNFDTFLKLLTTQLQNQDPLEPLDSKEFTQQLAQFSGVEQAIATNKNLEQLLSFFQVNQTSMAVGYLGKTVETAGDVAELKSGSAEWTYTLPAAAEKVTLRVIDTAGRIVWEGEGDRNAGSHAFAWDGKGTTGTAQPDGVYRLTVGALASDGSQLQTTTSISGTVIGVEMINGEPMLLVGGVRVPLENVLAVRTESGAA